MDMGVKRVICGLGDDELPPKEVFQLEPMSVFVGRENMTSDTLERIRYWAHRQLAKQTFHSLKTLNPEEFKEVAWRQIYDTLHNVPRMFQLWTCKQIVDGAGTHYNLAKQNQEEHDPCCPSCGQEI